MTIDYSKLNDRIVEQAYSYTLSNEEKQRLIQNKIERARILLASRDTNTVYHQIED